MKNQLLVLKRLLNSIDDEELKEINLWIDNEKGVDVIALDDNAISLITDEDRLSIDGKQW